MNERIKQLAGKAFDKAVPYTWHNLDHVEVEKVMKEFAELIIEQCIELCKGQLFADERVAEDCDLGYNDGVIDCVLGLKEHFGVEQ